MRKMTVVLAVLSSFAMAVPVWAAGDVAPVPDAKTQEALTQLAAKAKDTKTFSADFAMAAGPQTVSGRMSFMIPDKMRMTTTIAMQNAKMEQTTIYDGKISWILVLGMVMKVDMERVKQTLKDAGVPDQGAQHNLTNPVALLEAGSVKLTGTEKAGDQECMVFEGKVKTPPQGAPADANTARVYVATSDGLTRKLALLGPEGKEAVAFTYSNIKVNPDLPADNFSYTPAADAKVMDQTDMTIQILKKMLEKKVKAPPAELKAPETK